MTQLSPINYQYELFKNVHLHLDQPTGHGKSYLVKGNFTYFHYGCDGFNDVVSVGFIFFFFPNLQKQQPTLLFPFS